MERELSSVAVELRLDPGLGAGHARRCCAAVLVQVPRAGRRRSRTTSVPRSTAATAGHHPPRSCAAAHAIRDIRRDGQRGERARAASLRTAATGAAATAAGEDVSPTSSSTSGVRPRRVQRPHRRRRDAGGGNRRPRLGHDVRPRFEKRVIRQDQIGEDARLVEKAREAGDERHAFQRFPHAPRALAT